MIDQIIFPFFIFLTCILFAPASLGFRSSSQSISPMSYAFHSWVSLLVIFFFVFVDDVSSSSKFSWTSLLAAHDTLSSFYFRSLQYWMKSIKRDPKIMKNIITIKLNAAT